MVEDGGDDSQESTALNAFKDRLLLRIFANPSLLRMLLGCRHHFDGDCAKIQLDFKRLPDEVIPKVDEVVGRKQGIKVFAFSDDNGVTHTAYEISIPKDELKQADDAFTGV